MLVGNMGYDAAEADGASPRAGSTRGLRPGFLANPDLPAPLGFARRSMSQSLDFLYPRGDGLHRLPGDGRLTPAGAERRRLLSVRSR